MREFDIDKINLKQPSLERKLTGEVVGSLTPTAPVKPNAELEGGEYLMYPDGVVQKSVGQSHDKAGIKLNIPDGTKIISNYLKPTKQDLKTLKNSLGVKALPNDTYADVVSKYSKKIGLTKLNDEQEEVFAELKKVLDKEPNATNNVNREYLSSKIKEIEDKKQDLLAKQQEAFDLVFTIQESNKVPEEQGETFQYGGISKSRFNALLKKHGLTEEQGLAMLKYGGELRKYQDGDLKFDFTTRKGENPLYMENVTEQPTGDVAFGRISDVDKALTNLYRQFPEQFKKSKLFTDELVTIENGIVKAKAESGKTYNKVLDEVMSLQENMDKQMRTSANYLLENKDRFKLSKDKVKELNEYLEKETFKEKGTGKTKEEKVREYDGKLGEFTSGRFALGVDLVKPDERKTLSDKGIFTLSQIDPDTLKGLSEETQKRIEKFKDTLPEDADFSLMEYTTPEAPPVVEEKQPPKPDSKVEDLGKVSPDKGPRMFYTPDQRTLPPTAMLPHLKIDTKLGRIDPIRMGIEQQLMNISDSRRFAADRLDELPPSQRAAAMSSIIASSQQAENQATFQTNQWNAQNLAQTELFNVGQRDREALANAQNALDYEQRAYRARDVFDTRMRDWFLRNQKVALSDYDYNRKMNLASSLFPDYSPNYMGNWIEFDPDDEVSLENRRDMINVYSNIG